MDERAMMDDLPAVLTDPRLRDVDLDAHLDGLADDALLLGRYRVMATGGTSGVRGLFVYDEAGWVEVMGTLAFAPRWLGVPPRIPRPRMATIWASGPAHMTARLATSFTTPVYRRRQLAATMPIADMVSALNAFRPVWLSVYPSIAALLAEEQQAGRLDIAPRVVAVSSEQCTPAMRARIAATWGVQPIPRSRSARSRRSPGPTPHPASSSSSALVRARPRSSALVRGTPPASRPSGRRP
jgi:phenylacetate-CoA ligase